MQRYRRLVGERFMSEAALQQKADELLDARSQLAAAQRAVTALTRDLTTARLELAAAELRQGNHQAALDRQMSELEQELTEADARRTVVLTAPAAGTVTTILAEVGQTVVPGTPILSVLPAGAEMEAHLQSVERYYWKTARIATAAAAPARKTSIRRRSGQQQP